MECKYSPLCGYFISANKSCNPAEGEKPYCGEFRKFKSLEMTFIGRGILKRMRKELETGCASENL